MGESSKNRSLYMVSKAASRPASIALGRYDVSDRKELGAYAAESTVNGALMLTKQVSLQGSGCGYFFKTKCSMASNTAIWSPY